MNPIPDDDEMEELQNNLNRLNWWLRSDKKSDVKIPLIAREKRLCELDAKYAPLFERLEKG